jgi:hypothetical protein
VSIVSDVTLDACKQQATADKSITGFTFFTNSDVDSVGSCSLYNNDLLGEYRKDPNFLSYTNQNSMINGVNLKKPIIDASKISPTFSTASLNLKELSSYDYARYTLGSNMDSSTIYNDSIVVPTDMINTSAALTRRTGSYSSNSFNNSIQKIDQLNSQITEEMGKTVEQTNLVDDYNSKQSSINRLEGKSRETFIGNIANLASVRTTNHIITETDMRVIQSNYIYIIWCIVTIVLLIIAIRFSKK